MHISFSMILYLAIETVFPSGIIQNGRRKLLQNHMFKDLLITWWNYFFSFKWQSYHLFYKLTCKLCISAIPPEKSSLFCGFCFLRRHIVAHLWKVNDKNLINLDGFFITSSCNFSSSPINPKSRITINFRLKPHYIH